MTTAVREAPNHTKLTCVKHYGCRRPECVERNKAYQRARYRNRTAGTWQPLVDAEPVRQHILKLRAAGFTHVRISELSGLTFETITGFTRAYGNAGYRKARKRRCTPEVAAKILAIRPETAFPGHACAIGSRRRLQALVAAGWPMQHLGTLMGLSDRFVGSLMHQERCYGRTAEAIKRDFESLKDENPQDYGITPTYSKRARAYAARRKWPTLAYWADRMDVIDDPDFEPEYRMLRAQIIAEETHWLMTVGSMSRDQAATRLGVARFTVDRALREYPQDEQVAA